MSGPVNGLVSGAVPGVAPAGFAVLAGITVFLGSAIAAAEPVAVKVVDVAGGAAYLTPGRAAGIVPGTKVRLRGADAVVVEVTEKTAVIRIDNVRIAIGDAGTADVTPGAAATVARLDKPRSPDAFVGQWSDPILPATQQVPRAVPLGVPRGSGDVHVTVIGHAFATDGDAGAAADAEGRVITGLDLMTERPLAADLDVAARWFSDGADKRTRTPVLVRAAQVRYGDAADPTLAVGRLRFAAASVGMLDGGRARAKLGSIELAAFGGLVPDPLSGKPDTGAARFGAELAYDVPEAAWQPRVSLTAHGSTWDGKLDERQLSIAASAARGPVWLDGWVDMQGFAADNPWGASAIELAAAGASAQWSEHGTHAGIDLTFLRPERSLHLAAVLPPEWLCTLAPQPGAADSCIGGDWWGAATVSFGTRTERWAIDAVGSLGDSHGQYQGLDRSGYLRGELRAGTARLMAGLSGGSASFASWTAGELGVRTALQLGTLPALDLTLAYRPELLDYVAATAPQLLHSVSSDARLAVSSALDLALSAVGTTGDDRDVFALLATFVWRPLP
jgi:hypothetical protein